MRKEVLGFASGSCRGVSRRGRDRAPCMSRLRYLRTFTTKPYECTCNYNGHPYRYSEYTTRVLGATVSTSTLLLPTVTFSFAGSGSEQFDTTPLLASPYV